ncbi:hypothetical protein BG844_02365 [Couchioplanes caeruleus subsp. caeruleus]|uniref:Ferric iron reductase FhuF-like transporter n=2 Tax=Couchioplanes caeruleus TaxID=56438 RepID=A0A1K0FSU2_9ACTN|nr:hypothetical protein BG844_02365 [Couchioplanes caeruleus subsp. caeruleus]
MGDGEAHTGAPALAATAARLSGLDAAAGFDVGLEPGGDWVALAAATDSGHLDAWLAALVSLHGRRPLAGSLLGLQLARAVIAPTVAALVLDRRCPDPAIDNLVVRVDAVTGLDGCAVRRPTVALLPTDPAATGRDSIVRADEDDLHQWWARRAAATLAPILTAVRARAPFGIRRLWGAVSDEVTGTAIEIAQLAGRDPYPAWRYAQRLLAALSVHAPVALTRARPFPVAVPGGEVLCQVRGTCCLSYRSTTAAGPPADRYCDTCPLRDDQSRHRRLHDWLSSSVVPV